MNIINIITTPHSYQSPHGNRQQQPTHHHHLSVK